MGFSRRLNRLPLWLTAAFALAFSATQVAAQDARRLSKKTRGFDKVEEPAEIDSAPDGPVVVQILSLMDEPLPVTDIELGGIDIEVIDATQSPITARTSLQRSELYSATRTTRG